MNESSSSSFSRLRVGEKQKFNKSNSSFSVVVVDKIN